MGAVVFVKHLLCARPHPGLEMDWGAEQGTACLLGTCIHGGEVGGEDSDKRTNKQACVCNVMARALWEHGWLRRVELLFYRGYLTTENSFAQKPE